MTIITILLLLGLGLLLSALVLNVVSKKFKVKNATYKNAFRILSFEWLIYILIVIILGLFSAGLVGDIIAFALRFVAFIILSKRYYLTKLKQSISIYLIFNLLIAIIALAIILPVRTFVAQPFYVADLAMSPALNDKDYMIVKIFDKNFERGDIIAHQDPRGAKDIFLKRIIGLPGEKIQIRDNVIYIYNSETPAGKILDEPYLSADTVTIALSDEALVLGDNQYFVLGDNREVSKDSRIYGAVDKSLIIGKYWFMGMKSR